MKGRIKLSGMAVCLLIFILAAGSGYIVWSEQTGTEADGNGLAENPGAAKESDQLSVLYADIYERLTEREEPQSGELIEQIVKELGAQGITAVDGDNQTNMVNAGKADAGSQEESSLWMLPQAENCLLAEEEKKEIKELALKAGEQVKELYRDVEIMEGPSYGSNIREFTEDQRKEAAALLGSAGFTSVTKDRNMENSQSLEAFYKAYLDQEDAQATVVQVNQDGLLGVITFVHRSGKLQTYYVGVRWQEGGIPVIRDTSVSDVSEINLTEKGYFIYAYRVVVAHAALRQYWRVSPLPDQSRELAAKYIDGLSYVNYNLLIRNWDAGNVEEILTAGLFEDLYRMDTGENFRAEQGRIPAEVFERILTTYLPVKTEQLRESYRYEEESGSYLYERISPKAHPPFGEVVEYAENGDGTLTLIVDGVWPDYNSDCAFTNQIVVQPFADGTFRYLSNKIWQKELEIPRGIVTAAE